MSQNPANEMNESDPKNNESDSYFIESDSLINDTLYNYHDEIKSLEQNSFDDIQNPVDSSDNISNEKIINDVIGKIKAKFMKERAQIFNGTPYEQQKLINATLLKNGQLNGQLKERQQKLNKISDEAVGNKQQNVLLKRQTNELDNEIQLIESMIKFKRKIANLLNQERPLLNQGEPSAQIQKQIQNKLQSRSKTILDRLQPYLEYHLKRQQQQNNGIQETNKNLEKDGQVYKKEIERQENYLKHGQALKVIYVIQGEIENEKKYGNELNRYIQRNDADLEMRKNKNK